MVRRRSLKGVACGLATSFASRNNDADGYWAMGKLLKYANTSGVTELLVDLLEARDQSDVEGPVGLVADRYRKQLGKQLTTQQLSPSWAVAARIRIEFAVSESDLKRNAIFGTGQPFGCTVEIVDDNGRMYSAKAYGRVTQHDPEKECRSVRRDAF